MKKYLFLALVIVLFSQCRPAKMTLSPEDWKYKEEYTVAGKRGLFKKERMSFGDYYTTEVKRSWVKGTNSRFGLGGNFLNPYDYTNIISVEYIKRKQTIRFSMAGATRQESEVYCVSRFNAQDLTIGNKPHSIVNVAVDIIETVHSQPDSKYYVQLYLKQNERPWELLLDNVQSQLKPDSYVGYLSQTRDKYYSIVPIRQMEGKNGKPANMPFGAIGFEFRNKYNEPVAAVSLIDKGVVYFQNVSPEEKFLLANACAALLMQDVIG